MLKKISNSIRKAIKFLYEKRGYIILALAVIFIVFIAYEYYHQYFYILKNPKKIKEIILSYGQYSILAFLGLQIIQVVAFFIPGEVIQVSGGYIYGTLAGGLISLVGITMGSAIVYSISRLYGKPFIRKIISNKQMKFFDKVLKLGSINFVVFLLYLIPGIPKDVLAYICGISDINFKNFMLYSTLGRVPGIFISALFGARMYTGNKVILIVIAVTMSFLFILGVFRGEKIVKSLVKKD